MVSYTTLSPLPLVPRGVRAAVCSLWHCPADRSGWALPTTVPDGARTFLGPGDGAPRTRLPGRLVRLTVYAGRGRAAHPHPAPGAGVRNVSSSLPGRPGASAENGGMLILLPPSETKTRPSEVGATVLDLAAMSLPALHEAREEMLRAARRTAAGPEGGTRLGVPASSPELVGRMLHLAEEPVAPALSVYSGVLYDQLEAGLSPAQDRQVLVQSALFGLVDAATDRIPAYRLSASSSLAQLGKAGSWWRARLQPVAAELRAAQAGGDSPVVIDCRSGAYRSMMPMRGGEGLHVLEVAPVQERGGVRKVISHDAKRYRGLVTQVLLAAPSAPATPEEVAETVSAGLDGLTVELDGDRLVVVDRVD